MGIYNRIKDVAAGKGYSINRLEKELGLPRSSISKYNKNVPSMDKIKLIADFLGVSIDYLMTGNQPEGYYINPETAKTAQAIFDNPDLRALFDASADATPEDLQMVTDLLKKLKGTNRDG